ncbi:DUF4178 domain-containing protein [Halobacillus kuroshimensis]|uniref:DUF4178 domain-containing protein n=1 Tax=Halobacillus kuroshimensis TaxID=302481 RepID=A0ABS3E0I0_9BACI|nr:DUF4178 domain-containing protein [Halobacillus kuroshimensis]MBN8236934.1 DUF4178 domain-containing protein [Halobacillus kuroshimensis]
MGFFSRLFQKKDQQVPEVKERTPLTIEVGDIVTYDLADYEVVGKITYRDGSYEWYAYQLLEGNRTKWLAAEMDDELELGMYEKVNLPVGRPYPSSLEYEGVTYTKDEEGEAQVTGEGRSANVNGRTVNYADYISEDEEAYLSVEAWGTEVEVSIGSDIEAYELKIIAGSK